MNLIEKITQAILEDEENTDKQSDYLIDIYENSNQKEEIDAIFTCLCGYSLATLLAAIV